MLIIPHIKFLLIQYRYMPTNNHQRAGQKGIQFTYRIWAVRIVHDVRKPNCQGLTYNLINNKKCNWRNLVGYACIVGLVCLLSVNIYQLIHFVQIHAGDTEFTPAFFIPHIITSVDTIWILWFGKTNKVCFNHLNWILIAFAYASNKYVCLSI